MKKLLFLITTGSVLLSSCTKDRIIEGQAYNGGVTEVKATFENLIGHSVTKASMTDEGTFNWQNGDKAAFAESTESSYCSGTNSSTSATAVFELEKKCTFTENSWALYPFDLTLDQTPASLNVKVPASREWAEGQTNVAMYGVKKASDASFIFNHMGGLVRIRVNNVPTNAREFVFKASGYKINGVFDVEEESDFKVIKTSASDTESEQTYTLTWDDAPAAENTMDFYVPLPVGTYSNGFAFYLKDAEHSILYPKEGSTSQPVARKELLRMPEINLVGGEIEPTVVVKTISAGYSGGEYILPKSENVILTIDASGSNNDITLKYDGDSHLPANLEIQVIGGKFDKKVSGNLQYTHVDYIKGDIANVEITTSASTFNIVYPATISEKLIVTGGNVVLNGAIVKAIEVADGAKADGNPVRIEMKKLTLESGEEKTPAVTDTIVAKANIVVAPAEGVSVTVKPDGDDVTITPEGDVTITPEGEGDIISPLTGVFTVSDPDGTPNSGDEKKVRFSPGNLYVKKDESGNWNWNFYEEQYACNSLNSHCVNGKRDQLTKEYEIDEIDLFGWGDIEIPSEKNKYGIENKYVKGYDDPENDGETFSKTEDWGFIFGGESSVWRTLTVYEWEYLLNTRTMTNSKARYSNAMGGVTIGDATYKGVFLYPDNYNGEVVSDNSMTWDAINAAGIVFLPAAGYDTGTNIFSVGSNGAYWTSSGTSEFVYCEGDEECYEGKDFAYYLYFGFWNSKGFIYPRDFSERMQGNSVRLVTDVPE